MASPTRTRAPKPVGQLALQAQLDPGAAPPPVQSFVAGSRRTMEAADHVEEYYPPSSDPGGTLLGNLRFALRHEPLDLGILYQTLQAIGPGELEAWVCSEPTGDFSRRAWYFYETLTGRTLDLEPVRVGNYVDALNPRRHFTAAPRNSSRHRVRDNLLGGPGLCPTVRRTPRLEAMIQSNLAGEARAIAARFPEETVARVVRFLYTKETRSSFALEGEAPGPLREERFVQALQQVESFNPGDKAALIHLQRSIVDPRYAADDWRTVQNFVSETTRGFGQQMHFVCPRPQDVPALMQGWVALAERVQNSPLDPVLAAAVLSFPFVFIHPFEGGNGRIHRFLIHHALAARGFSPPGILFPISASILRDRQSYDRALEAFSTVVMRKTDWEWTGDSTVVVRNDTLDLFRFFDATAQAEYLYDRVADTIRVDLSQELEFLEGYDAAYQAVTRIVDMPDRRARLLVKLLLQNHGVLPNRKRQQFPELTADEIRRMEGAVQTVLGRAESTVEVREQASRWTREGDETA